ncbi:MAG: hypothetical protein NC253_02925 [Ruminococcus sp.]|nr:hypothetical protein [Ruminococcus sp.]MCM1380348.1 hypothetical protein [Muribaculaceae bacterium]MCM1478342.1 hypothetical protein [Muribaculaceae bacterium]
MVYLSGITVPVQLMSGLYKIPVCTKRVWDELKGCRTDGDYERACGTLLEGVPLPLYECRVLVHSYIGNMERLWEEAGLTIPYYKTEKSPNDVKYTVYTELDKLVSDYANMSLYEIDDIPVTEYRLILRDAFIYKLSQTEKGREYLKNAYRLTQTEADENLEARG